MTSAGGFLIALPAWCVRCQTQHCMVEHLGGKMSAEASARRRRVARVHGGQSGTVVPCGEVQQVRMV